MERFLIGAVDVRLSGAKIGTYHWRAHWAIPEKKLPDKPPAPKGAQETTPSWS